jgi:DNA-binding response OmpR family regulator
MEDGKYVILYVDDDPDVLMTMRAILEKNGYKMIEAPTAEDGLRIYKEKRPDLVIVDLMMEEVDAGTSMVKELQAIGSDVPVYMLSSVGDHLNLAVNYDELGLSGVFQKPIDPGQLLAVLKEALGSSSAN